MEICKSEKCSGCLLCLDACPVGAIEARTSAEGFLYPFVDSEKCISCGLCQRKCPQNSSKSGKPISCFAAYSKSREIRKESSSGGLFSALAEKVLSEGGSVFGAGFDGELSVVHKCVTDAKGLSELKGSKYVQSDTRGIFKKVEEELSKGKKVLFCAAPCQCSALRNYVGDREGLLIVDFICHGVPSPMVWKRYLEECFPDAESAYFRSKERGWEEFSMKVESERGTYVRSWYTDPYMRIFFGNMALRQSCYDCTHKGDNYSSDITLADFWGISKVYPEMNDDKGISAVIIRTEKGITAFEEIKSDIVSRECSFENIAVSNGAVNTSAAVSPKREDFFADMAKGLEFSAIIEKYARPMERSAVFKLRAKRLVKKVLYKLK